MKRPTKRIEVSEAEGTRGDPRKDRNMEWRKLLDIGS